MESCLSSIRDRRQFQIVVELDSLDEHRPQKVDDAVDILQSRKECRPEAEAGEQGFLRSHEVDREPRAFVLEEKINDV